MPVQQEVRQAPVSAVRLLDACMRDRRLADVNDRQREAGRVRRAGKCQFMLSDPRGVVQLGGTIGTTNSCSSALSPRAVSVAR